MTRQDLINKVSNETGIQAKECKEVINASIEAIKESVANGHPVFLRGFGTFIPKERAEKMARNISTNEPIVVPAHIEPVLKPSSEFKEMCNNK